MASLPRKTGPISDRGLRYNAKTSLATRQGHPVGEYLLRTTHGFPTQDVLPNNKHMITTSKHTKERILQEEPKPMDKDEPKTKTTKTYSSAAPSMQLARELDLATKLFTNSTFGRVDDVGYRKLFIYACSLSCKPFTLGASIASKISPAEASLNATGDLSQPMYHHHWHVHSHSAEGQIQMACREQMTDTRHPCIEWQGLEAAVDRMHLGKPWPADEALLGKLRRINAAFGLKTMGAGHPSR